jgi:hypothetical protein
VLPRSIPFVTCLQGIIFKPTLNQCSCSSLVSAPVGGISPLPQCRFSGMLHLKRGHTLSHATPSYGTTTYSIQSLLGWSFGRTSRCTSPKEETKTLDHASRVHHKKGTVILLHICTRLSGSCWIEMQPYQDHRPLATKTIIL